MTALVNTIPFESLDSEILSGGSLHGITWYYFLGISYMYCVLFSQAMGCTATVWDFCFPYFRLCCCIALWHLNFGLRFQHAYCVSKDVLLFWHCGSPYRSFWICAWWCLEPDLCSLNRRASASDANEFASQSTPGGSIKAFACDLHVLGVFKLVWPATSSQRWILMLKNPDNPSHACRLGCSFVGFRSFNFDHLCFSHLNYWLGPCHERVVDYRLVSKHSIEKWSHTIS